MKKITLLCLLVFSFVFTTVSIAQTLNQTANWTDASWTTSGTYTAAGLLNDPATDGLFTWDDDAAGNGSADTIESESPVIDLTAAAGAGETFLNISGNFDYYALGGDVLAIEYWDADAATWVAVAAFVGNTDEVADYQNCVSTGAYVSPDIDISGFTATQLSGFKYRFSYDDLTGWQYGWCLDPPTITSAVPPTCDVVTGVIADALTYNNLDFSWTAPVAGTPVNYFWEVVPVGNDQGVGTVASGTVAFPGTSASTGMLLSELTEYDLYIVTNCGADGSAIFGPASFTTPITPPVNDNVCDAISVAIGTVTTTAPYTNEGGSIETGETGPSCSFNTDPSESVWFSFVAPVSGEVLIATEPVGGGTLGDTQLMVYTIGDCTDFSTATEIACDDDDDDNVVGDGSGLHANMVVTGLVSGNTYYFSVDGYGAATGTFDVEVSDATLSVDSFVNENAFTYFPNPVNDELTLNAQNDIQNVSIYNMLGQEVIRTAPNAVDSVISMSELSQGAYFVQVTIGNVTETVRIIKQ